jgi:secondary thiamine-phosphate synthase enzyme
VDITDLLQDAVVRSGVERGALMATVVGSTGSLTTIEYEPGVIQDLADAIDRLAPEGMEYAHERAWHDGNGHSHVQAALLGPSMTLPIRSRELAMGTWQQAVVVNHDVRSRTRAVEVTIFGE